MFLAILTMTLKVLFMDNSLKLFSGRYIDTNGEDHSLIVEVLTYTDFSLMSSLIISIAEKMCGGEKI